MMRKPPAQPVNGLIDGLMLLQELATREEPVSCTELAKELGMETTRMNRLLKTLDYLGMADRTADRRYQAGPGIHLVAAQAIGQSKLLQAAARSMDSISCPGCTKALGVLWRDKVSYFFHKAPDVSFVDAIGRHAAYPASRSSIGMALLSELEPFEIDALYEGRAVPGFASRREFDAELETTRARGYGRLAGPEPSHLSIAFRIAGPTQAAAAVSGIMDARAEKMITEALASAVKDIERQMNRAKGI